MAPKKDVVDRAADELYALPPSEFTEARNRRAKELRGDGKREAADAVKALRKPTAAAWALNQLSRLRRGELDRLLEAGARLRAAQEELLAGGDREGLRKAAANERDLVGKLTGDALELASEGGERGAGLHEKLSATLHAAALDEETATALAEGRLLRESEAVGGFGGALPQAGGEASAPRPAKRRGQPKRKGEAAGAQAKPTGAQAEATGARAKPTGARAKPIGARAKATGARAKATGAQTKPTGARAVDAGAARRRERLAAARTDEKHARRRLESAVRNARQAAELAEAARVRAEAAEAHAAEAAKRAAEAKRKLVAARRAEQAARKAHGRAERSLGAAERDP